jgi:uncharacterized repeat protein (TIGR01451 family)
MLETRPPAAAPAIYVAIKYAECRARPVLAMPGGCGCEDEACEYSRIRDSFSVECLGDLPASHRPEPDAPTLCDIAAGRRLLTCPPCPTEPWVVLAKVTPVAGTAIAETGIDNKPPIRRLVFSTALIQQQVIKCCCGGDHGEPEPEPPRPRLAKLDVTKSASQVEFVQIGRQTFGRVRFEVKIRNLGQATATNVVVKDTLGGLPAEMIRMVDTFDVEPAGAGTWTNKTPPSLEASLGQVDPGKGALLSFMVTFDIRELPADAALENVAEVTTDTPLEQPSKTKDRVVVPVRRG